MLHIRNSLTNKKEPFIPWIEKNVTMYACGITPYDHSHIGHAMQALIFQMIRRYLEYSGYSVRYVRNYTDVDDKILARAKELKIPASKLSEEMIERSEQDFKKLNIAPADKHPRVSECIPEIISFIQNLIDKDYAYATASGHVYYRVNKQKNYGKLSNRNLDDMLHNTRDIVSEGKEHPLDFALWKSDPEASFSWKSPWSVGRPGWHIECSAMIHTHLGHPIDIHGGGRDLIFPHHENEIAQSEACHGGEFVKYWMHSGLMKISGQKMSKSLGNHISIQDFLAQHPAEVLKLCCLEHHYHGDVNFSQQMFYQAGKKLYFYYMLIEDAKKKQERLLELKTSSLNMDVSFELEQTFDLDHLRKQFTEFMDDDFNTVKVMAWLHGLFKQLRKILKQDAAKWHQTCINNLLIFFQDIHTVLGILGADPGEYIQSYKKKFLETHHLSQEKVQHIISERYNARKNQDWKKADALRNELWKLGIVLSDDHHNTDWHVHVPL